MNLAKNFASRREILSSGDSRQDRAFILAAKDLAEIRGSIPARFWPPRSCFPARISTRFAVGSRRDFGRRDSRFPARITARFAAGSRRDFGRRDFCFPARITARFPAGSRRDFGRREFRFPARTLPGSRRNLAGIPAEKKNPGGQNLAAIPTGSRQDPGPYFTRDKLSRFYADYVATFILHFCFS